MDIIIWVVLRILNIEVKIQQRLPPVVNYCQLNLGPRDKDVIAIYLIYIAKN
jgi:hypothetical protein